MFTRIESLRNLWFINDYSFSSFLVDEISHIIIIIITRKHGPCVNCAGSGWRLENNNYNLEDRVGARAGTSNYLASASNYLASAGTSNYLASASATISSDQLAS